jgi:hypothetical protein
MIRRTRKSFVSKDPEKWMNRAIRCGCCNRWMSDYRWDEFPDGEVVLCSTDCEIQYANAEEEDVVY